MAGPTFATPTLVWVKASGTTIMYPDPINRPTFTQIVDTRGFTYAFRCAAQLSVTYGPMIWQPGGGQCPQYPYSPTQEFTGLVTLNGSGTISRSAGINPPTNYTYKGYAEVTFTPVTATIQVTASAKALTPEKWVDFTMTVVPESGVQANQVPVQDIRWTFQPDNGGTAAAIPECDNRRVCSFRPGKSGSVEATALVNGTQQTGSVHVAVFPCLIGNPILDDPDVRRGLRLSWDSTHSTAQPPTSRTERSGALNCDANNTCVPINFTPTAGDNWCRNDMTEKVPQGYGPGTRVDWHTHGFIPDDPNDLIPANPLCGTTGAGALDGWPSPADFTGLNGHSRIVVDAKTLYFIPGTGDPFVDPSPMSAVDYPRSGTSNACDVLAPPL